MHDRHFDQLASRFAEKIYGGAKGAIRLAVLQADLKEVLPERPLRVLDIGAGLGHIDHPDIGTGGGCASDRTHGPHAGAPMIGRDEGRGRARHARIRRRRAAGG